MRKNGKNLTDLLDLNRSEVLHYLVRHSGCSRAELGEASGLTLPSITKTVRSLVESGAVYETGFAEGKKGRRSVGLSFNYEKYKLLSIRLSWHMLEVCIYDFLGNSYGQIATVTFSEVSADTIEDVVQTITDKIQLFRKDCPEIAAIGVAVPGPYYRDSGTVLLPPYSSNPAERFYYPLKEKIAQHTELPIFMEHDADAGALAYWWLESASGSNPVVMNLLADEGVGIGLEDNGHVFTGTSNCSCEMGHTTIDYHGRSCSRCGGKGCINAYCSAESLETIAMELLPEYPQSSLNQLDLPFTCQEIFQAVKQKDSFAMKLVLDCGHYMGHGISSLLHVFNPDIIIISGVVSKAGPLLLEGIQKTLADSPSSYTVIPEIRLFSSDKKLILLGAAVLAMNGMLDKPTRYLNLPVNN